MSADDINKKELALALSEIGEIKPYWSEEDAMYIFEDDHYPIVMYADPDPKKVIRGYKRALKSFISYRLEGRISQATERETKGRGGFRPGSGRPPKEVPSIRIRLPEDIATWFQQDPNQHFETFRSWLKNQSVRDGFERTNHS